MYFYIYNKVIIKFLSRSDKFFFIKIKKSGLYKCILNVIIFVESW